MKIAFISDTHFGGKELTGFQMQPRYVEHEHELCSALGEMIRKEKIDLLIHGGDMCEEGDAGQIRMVSELFGKYVKIPMVMALGNHDCLQPDCGNLWLTNAPNFFPQNSLDTTFIYDNFRIDILSLHWGYDGLQWKIPDGQKTHMTEEQWTRLRSGRQDLPRIIAMHSQLRAAMPERTGLDEPRMVPANNFAAVGDALIKEFSPVLILSGHSHINLQDRLEDTAAVVVSSFSETPFDCKIVEITDEKITMKTVSLVDTVDFKAEFNKENLFVMGDASVREFSKELK